ncbi:phosphomannomutase/phosphoglucomutase [Helicobacter sp. 23-1044]
MSIFREYDIRGIFGEDLRKNVVVAIGAELGKEILARGGRSVAIGYDARTHSPTLFSWLCEGILECNSSLESRNSFSGNHSADSLDLERSQTASLVSRPKSSENYESTTAIPSVVDSAKIAESNKKNADSVIHAKNAESQNPPSQMREDSSQSLPLPCGGGLRGWVDSANAESKIKIYDLGMIPTPIAYFSLYSKIAQVDSSIMITGSHNPPEYNGFKITILKKPFYGDEIRALGERIMQNLSDSQDSCAESDSPQNPQITKLNALNEYIDFLTAHFARLKNFPHKVAFDCGNGVAAIALKSVLCNLQIPYLPLFFEPNGNFPNHHPDPSEDKNLVFLQNAMKENDIKIGIAFDGDADRIGLLTEHYHFKGDELAILFARQIAKDGTKPVVIGEVKCSAVMYSEIDKIGRAIMFKTGHSNLKVKLSETNAHLAAEMSGHLFFNDRYFGYDDAIYASFRALELFLDESVSEVESFIKSLPQMFSTNEEKIQSTESTKFEIIKKLVKMLNKIRQNQQDLKDSQDLPTDFPKIIDIIDIDGIRVVFENGWGLIRASNTTPVLVTRFEATTHEFAELYKKVMLDLLNECQKDLQKDLR